MRRIVLTGLIGVALAGPAFTGPAFADFGVRNTWTDFQPAVSTQYRPADGGVRYRKPTTSRLLSYQPIPRDSASTGSRAIPDVGSRGGVPGSDRLNRPPSQVGR